MNIGKVIYELRKARGLTQEQLATAVGVSAPAVSKWETGTSLPDIGLLAPIARILGTNIDYLLSYKRDLSEEEVEEIWDAIRITAEKDGLKKGVAFAFLKIKEYPNSDLLKFKVAESVVTLAYTMDKGYTEKEYDELEKVYSELSESTVILFEELVNSENIEIRSAAVMGLAAKYMGLKRFDEAETILKGLSKVEHNADHMLPTLYLLKEDYEASIKMTQRNLLVDIQNVSMDIMSQYNVMLRKENYDQALFFAEGYRNVRRLFGVPYLNGADLFVRVYLSMGDNDNALKWFLIYADEIIEMNWNYGDSPYFYTLEIKNDTETVENTKKGIYKSIKMNPTYAVFKEEPGYQSAMDKLEREFGN